MCGPSKKVAFYSSAYSAADLELIIGELGLTGYARRCFSSLGLAQGEWQDSRGWRDGEPLDLIVAIERGTFEALLDIKVNRNVGRGNGAPVVWSALQDTSASALRATLPGPGGGGISWLQKIVLGSLDYRFD